MWGGGGVRVYVYVCECKDQLPALSSETGGGKGLHLAGMLVIDKLDH